VRVPGAKPTELKAFAGATAVAVTGERTCAVVKGVVRCVGAGPLGDGRTADSSAPRALPNLDRVVALSVAQRLACARRDDGTVACWGMGALTPVAWPGITDAVDVAVGAERACVAVAVGRAHACLVRRGGEVACWGEREKGAIGDGVADFFATAVAVPLER
jgi:hypothetical protein